MAFGLSGDESTYAMIGADVVVADWLEGQEARATDYKLTAYSQVNCFLISFIIICIVC